MANNALIIRHVQDKIDFIVNEPPKLLKRLSLIMRIDAVLNILYGSLWGLWHLFRGDTSQIPPLVLTEIIPDSVLYQRKELLKKLEGEVITFFEKLQNVLNCKLVVDLCAGGGWYIIPQDGETEELRIIDIYCDHVKALHEERLREERRRELEGSSSSEDSCNREF